MTRPTIMLAGLLAALTLVACASTAPSTQGGSTDSTSQPDNATQVTGSVMYRERIALTPDAVVQVDVVELQQDGSPGTVIGQQTIKSPAQVPIPFAVDIHPQRVRAEGSYAVNVRITDGARVFTTAAPVPVLTQGHRSSDVQVLVRSGG
jgi:putative lipoprotein